MKGAARVVACVRNTFLDFMEVAVDDEAQPQVCRTQTDSMVLGMPNCRESASQSDDESTAADSSSEVPTLSSSSGSTEVSPRGGAPAVESSRLAALAAAAARRAATPCPPATGATKSEEAPNTAASMAAPPQRVVAGSKRDGRAPVPPRAQPEGETTTLMLRNLPNDYTRDMILELLDATGFHGRYDFFHYPMDFARNAGLGYAFVNMLTAVDARQVSAMLDGFRAWSVPSRKVCSVSFNVPCQGLEANIERYRNSPIMHKSVPDELKPVAFRGGERVPFPKPTRKAAWRLVSPQLKPRVTGLPI